jgi:very-short-patch-repair endonuclease
MNKEKYLQIFNYLLEFSKLRSKPVRDIQSSSNYTDIIWFSDIPVKEEIACITHENSPLYGDEDFWLKIRKPKEPLKPQFPTPPEILDKWIAKDSLLNREDLPELLSETEIDGKVEKIDDYSNIKVRFEEYCENRWFSDSEWYWREYEIYLEQYAEFEQINTLYKKLFTIYNKSQQFGEEYELIIGIGLMHFRENYEMPLIFRHILTTKCDIKFEYSKNDSNIILGQNIENGFLIETDAIVDLSEQFESFNILEAEKLAKEIIHTKELTNPFDNEIHSVLQLLAERFKPGEGNYFESLRKSDNLPDKESVFYAPALILRKRDTRSYTSVFEQIINDIKQSQNLNISILNDLIGDTNELSNNIHFSDSNGKDQVIYFPNKYNDEQIAIINKSSHFDKVLVQGPPGTGKSHTIANLICHLLANGKKVLVTAYTKRALEVLKDKLPEEFRELAVSLLSGDSNSIQGLESSINKINEKLSDTDLDVLEKEISELEEKLDLLKRNKAYDTNELLILREKSSRSFSINPKYSGTLTEISALLDSEKELYNWYKDSFDEYENYEIIDKIKCFYSDFENYYLIDESIFNYKLPLINTLFDKESLQDYQNLYYILQEYDHVQHLADQIETSDIEKVRNLISELLEKSREVDAMNILQKEKIKDDLFKNDERKWLNKIERTKAILDNFDRSELHYKDQNCEVIYPVEKSIIALKSDAKILLDFLQKGNKFSGVGFKIKKSFFPNEIKERLYFTEKVSVNGSPCDSPEEFKIVLEDIRIKQFFEELSEIWSINDLNRNYESTFEYFYEHNRQVEILYELVNDSLTIVNHIHSFSNLKINALNSSIIEDCLNRVEFRIKLDRFKNYEQQKEKIIEDLSNENIHPIGKELSHAISSFKLSSYDKLIEQLIDLHNQRERHDEYKKNEAELSQSLPYLVNQISTREISETELSSLADAFLYMNAKNEVDVLLSENQENVLSQKLRAYDNDESRLIALLASNKTWLYVLQNLQHNNSLRQHLEAWVQAVKKIGKTGKGKRALKFRRMAQKEMEYCKTAIPCWIMPLYKVTETIQPEQGIYDYVIVDEASQLGPDAIFLLYITKNVIIVGDDKQTSPEYVGVDANAMTPYINRYLKGIPFHEFYGTESSFFDHAKRFRGAEIILREHFRCMPEIIEFSNKLFYAPDGKGLYPLKQYSENRLPPLVHHYCPDGFTEGNGAYLRNQNEALSIVKKIKEIVIDDRYNNKSIGVICLQGTAQSSLIETLLIKEIGETEYNKRKIICGNSASFQGDERDIIFLSLVTAQNHNRSALTRPEDERRFNVAVSRAIEQIWLFHSILLDDLSNQNDLRYKILDYFINHKPSPPPVSIPVKRTLGDQPEPFDSWFEVDVYNDIVNKGFNVKPQYDVVRGKYRLDMVAFMPDGVKFAIECDGDQWHGADRYLDDLHRQKVLERCGWQFYRIRGGEYYSNREKSLQLLWEMFEKHNSAKPIKVNVDSELKNGINNQVIDIQTYTLSENKHDRIGDDSNLKVSDHSEIDYMDQPDIYTNNTDQILRYFNLFDTGEYIMAEERIDQAKYSLPIKESQKNGFLLQCYESGNVNKVYVSTLLSRRLGREYMNGVNKNDILKKLVIIEEEKILGVTFTENGIKSFKAHLTKNISCRELLHLQGIKVIYNEYDNLEYHIIPINEYNNIEKLIFQSFMAKGKPMNNAYYANEWNIIRNYLPVKMQFKENKIDTLASKKENNYHEEYGAIVKLNKIVRIQYLKYDWQLNVVIVENQNDSAKTDNGILNVAIHSPLGTSLLGRRVGEIVKIESESIQVKIMAILN